MTRFKLKLKRNCIKSLKAHIFCSMSSLKSKYSCDILGNLSKEESFIPILYNPDQEMSLYGLSAIVRYLKDEENCSNNLEQIFSKDEETLEGELKAQLRDQNTLKKDRLAPYLEYVRSIEKNSSLRLAKSCVFTNLAIYSYIPGIQFEEEVQKSLDSFVSLDIFKNCVEDLFPERFEKFVESFQISETDLNDAKKYWNLNQEQKLKSRPPVMLPINGEENILITSALPYVNNVPHLGNIIGCVLSADCYSRFCRLRNINSIFISGTDEYGTATETKAMEEKLTPKEICDKYFKIHSQVYQWFNIDFDYFGRTSTPMQTEIAQSIFNDIYARGFTIEKSMDQLWCGKCSRFLADRFVEGTCPFCGYEEARGDQCDSCSKLINACELKSPYCKLCKQSPSIVPTKHLFLDLPKLSDSLEEFIHNKRENGTWSPSAKSISSYWIKGGLKPRCITRDLSWGTPVPIKEYENKVFYVWFDAPIGYLSITSNFTNKWHQWWMNPDNVKLVQFMAKDNVPFHTIIFPASLIATGKKYTMLNDISSIEYLNYEGTKFSKSRGVGVFGDNIQNSGISSDVFRFYLFSIRPETQDSNFMWHEMIQKNNAELLNNLGNFIYRSLSFLHTNFQGRTCDVSNLMDPMEEDLISRVNCCLSNYIRLMNKQCIRDALKEILEISRIGNQYFQHRKPWDLIKCEENKPIAHRIVTISANMSHLLAVLMNPFTPLFSQALIGQLNVIREHCNIPDHFTPRLPIGHQISKPSPLFVKLDPSMAITLSSQYSSKSEQSSNVTDEKPKSKKLTTCSDDDISIQGIPLEVLPSKIKEQGDLVRSIKENIRSEELRLKNEVAKLLQLKCQLEEEARVKP